MNHLSQAVILAFVATLSSVASAAATAPQPTAVPEPTTLSLVSGGVALVVIGARWLRRK